MTATAFGALIIILAGVAARRTGLVTRDVGPVLIRIVLYLALPCLVFLIIVRADLEPALLLAPVAGWGVHLVLVGLVLVWARTLRLERPRTGALVVATAVGNTGFFGLPLIAASGAGFSLAAAVMYDTFATNLITWTSTVLVASGFGVAHEGGLGWRPLARALLLPPNWALALGLALNAAGVHDLPDLVERPCEILSGAVLPLVMLYAGIMLRPRNLERVWGHVAFVLVARLGIAALLGLGIGLALGLDGDVLHTVVIMAAMPTALLSLVLGARFGLRTDVIADAVLVTTLACTATLPAIRALLV